MAVYGLSVHNAVRFFIEKFWATENTCSSTRERVVRKLSVRDSAGFFLRLFQGRQMTTYGDTRDKALRQLCVRADTRCLLTEVKAPG